MIIFGGLGPNNILLNDTWVLSGADGTAAGAVFDAAADKMIIFGGANASGFLNDIWTLSCKWLRWHIILETSHTSQHVSFTQSSGDYELQSIGPPLGHFRRGGCHRRSQRDLGTYEHQLTQPRFALVQLA